MEELLKVICYGVGFYVLYKAYFLFLKTIINTCKSGFTEIFSKDCCNFDEDEEYDADDDYFESKKNVLPRRTRYYEDNPYNDGDE